MEISSNAAVSMAAVNMKQTQSHQEVQIAVFKKAMDIQVQGALALIEALPTLPSSKGLPAHIGNNVNTVA